MNSQTAADKAGITYRQLDHWIRKGWIKPAIMHPGSGTLRTLNGLEVQVLMTMATLVNAGTRVEVAAGIARRLVISGVSTIRVGGVTLIVEKVA